MENKFTKLKTGICVLLILCIINAKAQSKHNIAVINNEFVPSSLTVKPGDTVVWTNTSGYHNVNGTLATYPSNPESFGNSAGMNWVYTFVFNTPGTYNYHCNPHVELGMKGKIIVEETMEQPVLSIEFAAMSPHVDQKMVLYSYLKPGMDKIGEKSVTIEQADFTLDIINVEVGKSYEIDFYADFNKNGAYDSPPADHAWRMNIDNVQGNTTVKFTHNANFTDIFPATSSQNFVIKSDEINIYPNPAYSIISIESRSVNGRALINIFSNSGQLLYTKEIEENNKNLDIGFLPEGTYLIQINTNDSNHYSKFIKLR